MKALRRLWRRLTRLPDAVQTPRSVRRRLARYETERAMRAQHREAVWERQWREDAESSARRVRSTYTMVPR